MYIMVMADEPSKRLYDYFDPEQFKDVDLMLFDKVIAFAGTHPVDFVITASMATEALPEKYAKYL